MTPGQSWNRVIPTGVKRVAPDQTGDCQPRSFDGAVFIDRLVAIMGTSGIKAASVRWECARNGHLVQPDENQKNPARKISQSKGQIPQTRLIGMLTYDHENPRPEKARRARSIETELFVFRYSWRSKWQGAPEGSNLSPVPMSRAVQRSLLLIVVLLDSARQHCQRTGLQKRRCASRLPDSGRQSTQQAGAHTICLRAAPA